MSVRVTASEWAQSRVPRSVFLIVEEAPEHPWQGLLGNAGKEQPRTAPRDGPLCARAPHGQGGNSLGWCRVTRAAASGSGWGDCHNSDGTPRPFKFWDTGPPVVQSPGKLQGQPPQCGCFWQTYFEDNPKDLQLLRHDLPLHPAVVKPHLGHVPDYLGEWARAERSCHSSQPCADSAARRLGVRAGTRRQVAVSKEAKAGCGLGVTA